MSEPLRVDLFVEDVAHEKLLVPLVERIATLEERSVRVMIRSARGGHSKALEEMRKVQDLLAAGTTGDPLPELFVVGIDGNCSTAVEKRKAIIAKTRQEFVDRLVIACPDPHIERWYMADPDSFHEVVGSRPALTKSKCQRDHYVQLLASTVREAGHPNTLGGIEWAADLVANMDLYRAAKNDNALGHFLEDLRHRVRVST